MYGTNMPSIISKNTFFEEFIRIRIRIKLYFTFNLVLKAINIIIKLSVTNGNHRDIKQLKLIQ